MAIEAGDIISRLLLDMSDFRRALKSAPGIARKDLQKVNKAMSTTMRQMDKSVKGFVDRSEAHGKKFEKGWWARFGAVAIGFTIAYRAMNVLERGLQKLSQTTLDAIRESGELASLQAKLALWTAMHSKGVIEYGEAFIYARGAMLELMKASVTSLSSIEELSTGLDEMGQTLGTIRTETVGAAVDLIDFTVLVAQTTGSVTRQVRQEIQSLLQGQVRTTDIVIRTMRKMGVLTDENIAKLKDQVDVQETFDKVLVAISAHMAEFREQVLRTDVNKALAFWEKSIRVVLVESVLLASVLENVGGNLKDIGNIFALELNKRAKEFRDSLTPKDVGRLIVAMQGLRNAFALGLDMYESTIRVASILATVLTNLYDEISLVAKGLGGILAAMVVVKAFELLGRTALWLADVPVKLLIKAFHSLYIRMMLIPVAALLAYTALETLGDLLPGLVKGSKSAEEALAEMFPSAETGFDKAVKRFWIRVKNSLSGILGITQDKVKEIGKVLGSLGEQGGAAYVKNLEKHLDQLMTVLAPIMEKLGKALKDVATPDIDLEALMAQYREYVKVADLGVAEIEKKIEELDLTKVYRKQFSRLRSLARKWHRFLLSDYQQLQKDLGEIQTLANIGFFRSQEELNRVIAIATERYLAKRVALYRNVYADISKLDIKYFEFSIQLIELQANALRRAGVEEIAVQRWIIQQKMDLHEDFFKDIQDLAADTFYEILTDESFTWEKLFDKIYDMYARMLADMAAEAIKNQIVIGLAQRAVAGAGVGGLGINPMTGAAIGGAVGAGGGGVASFLGPSGMAAIAGLVVVGGLLGKMHDRHAEANRREFERLKALAAVWKLVSTEITDLLYANTALDKALRNINNQFDEYKKTLETLGVSAEQLTWVEEKRAEALEKERQRLLKEFAAPLEAIIAGFTMGDVANELRMLDNWYADQIENARALGQESVNLLREALELSKKQLAIKQMETLIAAQAAAQEIILTIGMTPMELQIHMIEQARDELGDAIDDIGESVDALVNSIGDTEAEIISLQQAYDEAFSSFGAAETRWMDARQAVIDKLAETMVTVRPAFGPAVTTPIKEAYERDVFGREVTWEEFLEYLEGKGYFEGWKKGVPLYAGLAEEYFAAQVGWAEAQAKYLPLIESIPGEIDTLEESLVDYRQAVADLIDELKAAGETQQAAYVAQMAALTETFLGGLQDIIRSHTLSEYELALHELNEWYEEQVIAAEALGLSLDLVNQAYDLQAEALLEAALASSDLADSLEEWKSILKSIEDQIFDIQTSMQNPLDVLERMAIAEQDIIDILGTDWQEGMLDLSGLSPEALADLQDLLAVYLDLAGEAFQRPSMEYGAIYTSVLDALESMAAAAEEQVTDYEIQLEQLEAQLRMADALEDLVDEIPSAQVGRYIHQTGLYRLHEGEEVISAGGAGRGTQFEMYLTINESATPHETGRVVTDAVKTFLRSSQGRTLVQETSKGR